MPLTSEERRQLQVAEERWHSRRTDLQAVLKKMGLEVALDTGEDVHALLSEAGLIREPLLRRDLEILEKHAKAYDTLREQIEQRAAKREARPGPWRQVRSLAKRV